MFNPKGHIKGQLNTKTSGVPTSTADHKYQFVTNLPIKPSICLSIHQFIYAIYLKRALRRLRLLLFFKVYWTLGSQSSQRNDKYLLSLIFLWTHIPLLLQLLTLEVKVLSFPLILALNTFHNLISPDLSNITFCYPLDSTPSHQLASLSTKSLSPFHTHHMFPVTVSFVLFPQNPLLFLPLLTNTYPSI